MRTFQRLNEQRKKDSPVLSPEFHLPHQGQSQFLAFEPEAKQVQFHTNHSAFLCEKDSKRPGLPHTEWRGGEA